MRAFPTTGVLVLSVDLESARMPNLDLARRLDTFGRRMLDLLAARGLAASWPLSYPADSPWIERIASADRRHDVALAGDSDWIGRAAPRAHVARELSKRIYSAQAAGLSVKSLAVRGGSLTDHVDLVVKHGVRAVRGVESADQTRAIRWGLWSIPPTTSLPTRSSWHGGGLRMLTRLVDRTAAESSVCHVTIDGANCCRHPSDRMIERLLLHVDRLRRDGRLQTETLASAAERFTGPRHEVQPARSILRVA